MERNGNTVTITAKQYENLHQKIRNLEQQLLNEKQLAEATRVWAVKAFDEQRYYTERCTFLYGAAMAYGATHAELAAIHPHT